MDLAVERGFRIYWCTFFKRDLGSSVSRAEKLARGMSKGKIPSGGDGDLLRSFVLKTERAKGSAGDEEILDAVAGIMNEMEDFGCKE